jgi:hypothetical protein
VLIWRVAGAVPDVVVVVPGPIASTPFVEQAVQRSGGRHPDLRAKDSPVTDDARLHTDLRSASRNLQVTHELVSEIYVSFAISDFADVHSAFHWPPGDGTP